MPDKVPSNPIRNICNNAKIAVIVLMQTLSTFPTYPCLDTQVPRAVPGKAFLRSFSDLNKNPS